MPSVDKKTSEEDIGAAIQDLDFFRAVQAGGNVRFSFAQVRAWITGWINKGSVGLGNVDNTSDATKNIAIATLKNKAISGSDNTITNLALSAFADGVIDTDGTLAANSDGRLATQKAIVTYFAARIAALDVVEIKGGIDCSSNPNYPAADAGALYKVTVAGKIGGASGPNVEAGDTLFCFVDASASGNHATVGANWTIVQVNIDGVVTGPASSVSGNIPSFSGTGGKLLQDSGKAAPSGAIVGTSDTQTLSGKTISGAANTLTIREADLSLTDNTTANASTSAHGFLPKLPGGTTSFLRGDGNFATPSGSGNVSNAGSSTDNAAARFDGTSGTDIQDSALIIADTTGAISRNGGGGIPVQGTNTNDSASSGYVGEYVSSSVVSGSAVSLTTTTPTNMTFIDLSAGDWDVTLQMSYSLQNTTSITTIVSSISTTSATNDATPGHFMLDRRAAYVPGGDLVLPPITVRVSLNASTRIYGVAQMTFTIGTAGAYGLLSARRER
jgi:hypothetical protein